MSAVNKSPVRWAVVVGLAAMLAACGGGGGSSDPAPAPAPAPVADARNGSYTMVAADANVYTLALDFDAKTYHVAGNSVDQSGAITESSGEFSFAPGNASGASGSSTTRFQVATDTIVGEFSLPSGAVPFVAPRKFVNTPADAAGVYNMLGRTVDTTGAAPNTTIQQGQITADGHLNTCDDSTIYDIANCPPASVTTGPLTVSGDVFTAATANGSIVFRVAMVGTDKVFVRASTSVSPTRRFVIGLPDATSAPGTFAGGTSEPAWGTVALTDTTFSSTGIAPTGVSSTMTGTVVSSGFVPAIRFISTASSGGYFAIRSSELGAVVSTRGSTAAPGFIAIGRKQ